ncbi:SRPBCC domain-containing protein [Roseiterribacter gracilis]|uniref:Activator of HSP90 ATPase n=1 Tax=Roseiterribacter gracilis TaxID=2812848 RepID=A0A8S8XC19_9PROT|nr:activator of HSP90 ATPase [Rhodospirillales bacterium TMPK1]
MSSTVEMPEQDPLIIMTRVFDAPRALVWETFTDCKHQVHWWGGHGWTLPVCEIELRPGGAWRQVMRTPEGAEYPLNSVIVEVQPPERLVWTDAVQSTHPDAPPSPLHTVTFEDLGNNKTKWHMVARFPSAQAREMATKMGYTAMIETGNDRLAAYLATR